MPPAIAAKIAVSGLIAAPTPISVVPTVAITVPAVPMAVATLNTVAINC